jgi:hypothetical protein
MAASPGLSRDSRARIARERLRRRYSPEQVRLLFIGEAPPASGRFFYQRDSGLYRALRDSLRLIVPSLRDEDFLPTFQSAGCLLIDLCADPVDRLDRYARRAACLAAERSLACRLRQLQPQSIATVVRSIRDNVERAASQAAWHGPILDLPYPGRWERHRNAFLKKLVPQLRETIGNLASD